MPSVEVMPTLWPIPFMMWLIIRTVVVFPFEPVTETIGMRDGDPGGNSMSITGLATYWGSPSVGLVCIRNPGAAFTSTMAPPVSRTGWEMSGVRKSIPATSRPTTRPASSATSMFSSWASHVRSMEMPPVDIFPVAASLMKLSLGGTSSTSNPCFRTRSIAVSSILILVRTLSWPIPRRGS